MTHLIDSHCHLHTIDLSDFNDQLDDLISQAEQNSVERMLCVCLALNEVPQLRSLAERYPSIYTSVGIHPNNEFDEEAKAHEIAALANHPSCIAIGETGLDYYRTEGDDAIRLQQEGFREHIRAALDVQKPLIIHTRMAPEDTLRLLEEEKADQIGGVLHCFTENWDMASRAIDMGFYISFSGIVSFKNARQVHEVAQKVPLDRLLIETDAPYLAPVPYRGKQNHPALVKHVAEALAELRNESFDRIAEQTTTNFYRCFKVRSE